jgi:hypothetical protein
MNISLKKSAICKLRLPCFFKGLQTSKNGNKSKRLIDWLHQGVQNIFIHPDANLRSARSTGEVILASFLRGRLLPRPGVVKMFRKNYTVFIPCS